MTWLGRIEAPSGAVLVCFALGGCSSKAATGLDQETADRALLVLKDTGVPAQKTPDSTGSDVYTIWVSGDQLALSIETLHAEDIPPPREDPAEDPLTNGLVLGRNAEAQVVARALSERLQRTLRTFDGVASARVHLAPAEDDWMKERPSSKPTAAVVLRQSSRGPAVDVAAIARVVSSSATGVAVQEVSVTVLPARSAASRRDTAPRVAPAWMRALLTVALSLNVALVGAILYLWVRLRRSST